MRLLPKFSLRKVAKNISRSPLRFGWTIFVLPVSLYGLYEGYKNLIIFFGSSGLISFVLLLIFIVIILFIIKGYMDIFSKYNIDKNDKCVVLDFYQHWHINSDGTRDVSSSREFVYYKQPEENDFKEVVFSSRDLSFEDSNYQTSDADILKVENTSEDFFTVFYKPKEEVKVAIPYHHEFSYTHPSFDVVHEKSITFGSKTSVGSLTAKITTDRRIKSFLIKKGDGLISFNNEGAIENSEGNNFLGVVKSHNQNEINLDFGNLMPGEHYFVSLHLH